MAEKTQASTENTEVAGGSDVASKTNARTSALARRDASADRGRTTIADVVVAKVAGIAAREIDGVHDLGGATERVVGKVRDVMPGASVSSAQGIEVEVGEKQAAIDVSIVAEYGVAIHQLAEAIRRNVISAIEQMTGLEVTEVNVTVNDIAIDDDDQVRSDQPRVE